MDRVINFAKAINEATALCMEKDPSVYIMGLGVPDPKGIFGTTLGLVDTFGSERVMDMPVSENAMTGVAIGSALTGMRPIMTHQRIDFAILTMEQIVNQAAKWHYMFDGQKCIPLVIRMIVGRGWGQGAQHSQSLESWFAHVPGLKVIMPSTAYDAKGMMISAIEDDNPVISIEHRWLYNVTGDVPEEIYRVPVGKARVSREGSDITIVATSFMAMESLRAAGVLEKSGIDVEVIDMRTVKPIDTETILASIRKTGRLLAVDSSWTMASISSEVAALAAEYAFESLKCPVRRIGLPDCPSPTSPGLSKYFYPRASGIVSAVKDMLGKEKNRFDSEFEEIEASVPFDVPDQYFTGPF